MKKKLISILLCAVMLSVYLTVLAVPAMANTIEAHNLEELYEALDKVNKGDTIEVYGNGQTWYVNELIYINKSCKVEFHDVNLAVGDDGDYNYYDGSLIEVNQHDTTLDFYNCTFDTDQHDLLGDGELVCEEYGSVIYVDGNNCVIDGHDSTVFNGCKTSAYYGGAIYIDGWDNCTIKNATFENCEASYQGGAIYVYGNNCTVGNCKFSGCYAPNGGSNVYSYYEGKTTVGGCTNTNGNPIDGSTCVNCVFESADEYFRRADPCCVRHLALPETGTYVIRSAVDPDYCFDTQDASVWLRKRGETEFQVFRLERQHSDPNAFMIRPAYYEYSNNKYCITLGNTKYQVDEIYMDKSGWNSWNQSWYFEDDAPGDNCYYIHSMCGGWLEAAGCVNGNKPYSGCDVLYSNFTGYTNQMWILEKVDAPYGSTISEGNGWIIGIGAVVIVGGIAAILVVNKKKKTTD